MVGVAGKSKACYTCKRRRVKCDFRQPSCFRCEKANVSCDGYEQGRLFVNRTPTQRSVTAASAISKAKREDNRKRHCPPHDEALLSLISEATNSSSTPIEFRRHAVELLCKIYLPQPPQTRFGTAVGSIYSWIQSLSEISGECKALDLSLLAFCVVQTRFTNTSSIGCDEALRFYSEALQHHRADLEDEQKRSREESLATIIVLTTFELFAFPYDYSWRIHASGVSEMLRLRDRSEPLTPIWNSLCSRLHMICVLDGLTKQRPLSLTSAEWLEISKNVYAQPVDNLLDIVTPVPGLMAQSIDLMTDSYQDQRDYKIANIIKELIGVINQIQAWLDQERSDKSRLYHWAVISTLHNPADDEYANKLFPFTIEFDSIDASIWLTFTCAIKLHVFNSIILIYDWFHENSDSLPCLREVFGYDGQEEPQTLPTYESHKIGAEKISVSLIRSEADSIARLLCQTVGYCYRADIGTLGPQSLRYVQWTLRQFFRQNPGYERELKWVLQIKNITGPGLHDRLDLMEFGDNL